MDRMLGKQLFPLWVLVSLCLPVSGGAQPSALLWIEQRDAAGAPATGGILETTAYEIHASGDGQGLRIDLVSADGARHVVQLLPNEASELVAGLALDPECGSTLRLGDRSEPQGLEPDWTNLCRTGALELIEIERSEGEFRLALDFDYRGVSKVGSIRGSLRIASEVPLPCDARASGEDCVPWDPFFGEDELPLEVPTSYAFVSLGLRTAALDESDSLLSPDLGSPRTALLPTAVLETTDAEELDASSAPFDSFMTFDGVPPEPPLGRRERQYAWADMRPSVAPEEARSRVRESRHRSAASPPSHSPRPQAPKHATSGAAPAPVRPIQPGVAQPRRRDDPRATSVVEAGASISTPIGIAEAPTESGSHTRTTASEHTLGEETAPPTRPPVRSRPAQRAPVPLESAIPPPATPETAQVFRDLLAALAEWIDTLWRLLFSLERQP